MIFEIDDYPIDLNPYNISDFNSKMINQVVNLYLRDGINCYIKYYPENKCRIFLIDNMFTLEHIKEAIILSSKKSKFKFLFEFIKKKNELLNIKITNNYLEIETYYHVPFLKEILQAVFVPIKINIDYIKYYKQRDILCLYNKEKFFVNKSNDLSVKLLKEKKITYSCFSHPNYKVSFNKYIEGYDYVEDLGSFLYCLNVKDKKIKDFLIYCRLKIQESIPDYVKLFLEPANSLILNSKTSKNIYDKNKLDINEIEINVDQMPDNTYRKEITVAYCDFNPNKEIIEIVLDLLQTYGIKCNLKIYDDFRSYNHEYNKFDISLVILFPIFEHKYGISMLLINDLNLERKKNIKRSIIENDYNLFENQLKDTEHIVPFFQSKNVYMKKKHAKFLDEYGRIIDEKI